MLRSLLILASAGLIGAGVLWGCGRTANNGRTILNVSYDPTREFYQEYKEEFAQYWQDKTGEKVTIQNSHGGSGSQAHAVINGQEAAVVTLALAYDIDAIAEKANLLPADWQKRLPHNSCPYTSTIVFLVREGNPKQIKDWDDLVKPGVEVITPNPATSGGARWNYLAAWGFVLRRELGDLKALSDPARKADVEAAQTKAKEFVAAMFRNVKTLDSGARGSTMTFVDRRLGDVLLAWENEALLISRKVKPGQFEVVYPSLSILAEPPVAVIDKVVDKHGSRVLAEAYLKHLYSDAGQALAAKHFYRPSLPEKAPPDLAAQFGQIELFTIDDVFGGWAKAQREHFDDGATFDQIFDRKR